MRPVATDRVLVLGAGPVGLGTALELARCGVRSVLIEKHDSTSWHPKTRNFNTRTMEIARGWGPAVYERLRGIDTPPGWKSPIRFTRTAVGEELGVIESKGFEGPGPDVSPAWPVMSSQELIEAILLDAVRATRMVDVRFATEATKLVRGGHADDDTAALEVRSRATGASEVLAGRALVGADGSASLVRHELGVELEGAKELRHIVNCYFRADIERHIGDRKGVLFFVSNEQASGVLQPLDGAGRWLCQIAVAPYSYDWIDNGGRRSPRTLTPGVGDPAVGDRVQVFRITEVEPGRQWSGVTIPKVFGRTAVTYAVEPDGHGSRLVCRITTSQHGPVAWTWSRLLAWGDLVMMRKQLLTFKELAETAPPAS